MNGSGFVKGLLIIKICIMAKRIVVAFFGPELGTFILVSMSGGIGGLE